MRCSEYQIICLHSQGNFFISNPDAVLLFIKCFIRESDKWSVRCDVSRPNSSSNIFYFLFAMLFILPLNICSYTCYIKMLRKPQTRPNVRCSTAYKTKNFFFFVNTNGDYKNEEGCYETISMNNIFNIPKQKKTAACLVVNI